MLKLLLSNYSPSLTLTSTLRLQMQMSLGNQEVAASLCGCISSHSELNYSLWFKIHQGEGLGRGFSG